MFVRRWMSTPVVTVQKVVPVDAAKEFMRRKKVRRLPVLDGEKLAGIVTLSDLEARSKTGAFVEDVMTRKVRTVAPGDTLEQAASMMIERQISGLPVVEKDRVLGILTESDVFRALCEILGVRERGARVAFSVPEGADFLEVLRRRSSGLVVRSLATLHDPQQGAWDVVMRVRGRAAKLEAKAR